jgi:gliding motility-associated-like protein
MKKVTLLLFMSLMSLMGYSQFGPEDFEGSFPPPGWAIFDERGPTFTWSLNEPGNEFQPAHSGTQAAFMERENVPTGTAEDWLVTPRFNAPTSAQLRFWSRLTIDGNQGTTYEVKVSTDPDQANRAAYTTVQTWTESQINPNNLVYLEKVVALTGIAPGTPIYIAFVMRTDNGDRWLIDDVSVVQECLKPTNLAAGSITQQSAVLTWANPANATAWEVEVVAQAGTPTGTGVRVEGAPSYTAGSLTQNTCYKFYVRSECSANNKSEWAGPFQFCTASPGTSCGAPIVITGIPYTTTDNTSNYGDTFYDGSPGASGCGTTNAFLNGNDVVYAYTATADGAININLSGIGPDTGMFIYNSCDNIGVSCIAGGTGNATTPISVPLLSVISGTTYYIVISTWPAPQTTAYTLSIQQVTCPPPTGLTVNGVTATSANLTWAGNGSTSWEVIVQAVGAGAPTGAGTPVTSNNFTTSQTTSGTPFTSSTSYEYYVRGNCPAGGTFSTWSGPFVFSTTQVPGTLNYSDGFEGAPQWSLINGNQTNKWVIGSAVNNGGTQSLYISNTNGTTNAYSLSAASRVMAYRDLAIPAGANEIYMTFDWRAMGETVTWDYFRVWSVPASFTPTAGTAITAANSGGVQVGGTFNNQGTFTTASFILPATAYQGTTRRFIFEWINDGSGGTQPPAAIDNVNISVITCTAPTALTASGVTLNGATLAWTAPTGGAPSYDYYYSTSNTAPTATTTPSGNVTATTTPISGLSPSTTYYAWVRSNCGGTNGSSFWVGPAIINTPQIPATLTFSDGFEGAAQWTLLNGNQPNRWVIGNAVNNGGANSLYISNNNGAANAYSLDVRSIVHAYRDIQMPTPLDQINLAFDWRAVGEGTAAGTLYDYIRVWLVPVTFVPEPGTQITAANSGGIQVVGSLNQNPDFITQNFVINAAPLAGTTSRLIFEWINDTSAGTQPPAAIDNVNLSVITCSAPGALAMSALGSDQATFTWTAPASGAASYDYYYSTSITTPAATATPNGNVTATTATAASLTPNTQYYFWVRSNCGADGTSTWTGPFAFVTTQIPASLPYVDGFEGDPQWGIVNGTQTNKWVIGNAVNNGGTNSLYITDNNGATNTYNLSATSTVQAYRDILMPTGVDQINLSFDWRAVGEGTAPGTQYDYIRVWLVPATYRPVAGTQITAANSGGIQLSGSLNQRGTFTTANYVINSLQFAGTTRRLVFEWRNDGSGGTQPPAAIDNVNLSIITCSAPTALTMTNLTDNAATFTWTGPASSTPTYDYYYSTSATAPTAATVPNGNVTATTATASSLTPLTQYYFWVRSNCGATDGTSTWTGPIAFITTQVPATITYTEGFEGDNTWALVNGTETNKWTVGTAVANGGTHSLYITNDNGASNAYTITAQSTVHAFRDIAIPADVNEVNLSFDWRAAGQTTLDYFRVWLVPVTFNPTAGTQITAANSGGVQVAGNFNQNGTFTTAAFPINTSAYDGQIRRIVFEWRNNASTGTQPPAAIDNISIAIPTCPRPINIVTSCASATSANVAWEQGGAETSWEVAVVAATAAAPTSGTVVTSPVFLAENLTANTNYTVYVRALCSSTDKSFWSQANFATTSTSVLAAQAFCASASEDQSILFPNIITNRAGYGEVACLGSTPSPVWYYLQVDEPGTLNFQLIQNTAFNAQGNPTGTALDVDFVAFGPFGSLNQACGEVALQDCPTCVNNTTPGAAYPVGNIVDCSFDAAAIENFTINNAQRGQIYAVLITNYNGAAGSIKLQQLTTSTGSTNCDILYNVELGSNQLLCGVDNATITATVTTPGISMAPTYEWFRDGVEFTPTIVTENALTQTIRVTEPGRHIYSVIVSVQNAQNTEPITDQVTIVLTPAVNLPDPAPVVLCGVEGTATVDLATLNAGILGTLNPADYVVEYYTTLAAANAGTNPINITAPYNATAGNLFVRVESVLLGTCFDVVTLPIVINATGTATIVYTDSPYCSNETTGTVTQTGTTGGTFTAASTGTGTGVLVIDPATGAINIASSNVGTYTVTYTVASTNTCPDVVATATVEIVAPPTATIAYANSPFCTSGVAVTGTVTQTGTTGGTYTAAPTGTGTGVLVIDPATGAIDIAASNAGTYTVTYTVPGNGACAVAPVTTQVEITPIPVATINYAGTPYCANSTAVIAVTQTGNTGGTYSVTSTGTGVLAINPSTGAIDIAASQPGQYTVSYTIAAANGCGPVVATAPVVITAAPVATFNYDAATYCQNFGSSVVPTFDTGASAGRFTYTTTGTGTLSIDPATGAINPATSGEGIYVVTNEIAAANGCTAVSHQFTITIVAAPLPDFTYASLQYCQDDANDPSPIVTGVAGTFGYTTTGTGRLVIDAATGAIDLSASDAGIYTVTNTIAATAQCSSVQGTFVITINATPTFDLGGPYNVCDSDVVTIAVANSNFDTATATYVWSYAGTVTGDTGSSLNVAAGAFGDYQVTVTTVNGCTDSRTVSVTKDTNAIALDFADNCEGNVYVLEVLSVNDSFNANASFTWTGPQGFTAPTDRTLTTIRPTVPGIYSVTVQTVEGCIGVKSFTVDSTSCLIQKGISPNGDGLNDSFELNALDVTHLSIFNRYGQEVFTFGNYTDEWYGQNKNGDELPTGTYFYSIERANGEAITGWIYVNREE